MNHRPLHYVVPAMLVALTQILSACSDDSAAATVPPAAAMAAPPGSEQGPQISSDAVNAEDQAVLANLLATGMDSNDAESYWFCTSDPADQGFYLRLWADGLGYVHESNLQWHTTSGSTAEMLVDGSLVTLGNLVFIDEAVPFDRFMGKRNGSEPIDCLWGGPSRYNELGVQQDSADGLAQVLAGDRGSRDWSCTVNRSDGSVTTPILTYADDRTGTGEAGAFTWYFDDDLLFMAAGEGLDVTVFHDFSLQNNDPQAGPLSFTAGFNDAGVQCSTAG